MTKRGEDRATTGRARKLLGKLRKRFGDHKAQQQLEEKKKTAKVHPVVW